MKEDILFEPIQMAGVLLNNKIIMAPLTRNRASEDGSPKLVSAIYYAQRASAGLIISEASHVNEFGKGYLDTPGIYTTKHESGWKDVVDCVHDAGGLISQQLWHVGRISHTSLLPVGAKPLSPSGRKADSRTFVKEGFVECSAPDPLTLDGILDTVKAFGNAASLAKKAGFDGIEIHAANGYLIDQFLSTNANDREDDYGGSIENNSRFLFEIIDAVQKSFPKNRIGVRLSPLAQFNDIKYANPEKLFTYIYKKIAELKLGYLHVVENFSDTSLSEKQHTLIKKLRKCYDGFYIANGGYDRQSAEDAIFNGHAHAVSFGKLFISNPDLPRRFKKRAPLIKADENTFYGGGAKGYTDYPFLD